MPAPPSRSRSTSRTRHASVAAIWLNVKTWSPATTDSSRVSAGASLRRNRSASKPRGLTSRATVRGWWSRNRAESPTPDRVWRALHDSPELNGYELVYSASDRLVYRALPTR